MQSVRKNAAQKRRQNLRNKKRKWQQQKQMQCKQANGSGEIVEVTGGKQGTGVMHHSNQVASWPVPRGTAYVPRDTEVSQATTLSM